MDIYHLDYETYSNCNLKTDGEFAYAEHPSTRILIFAIKKNDGEVHAWTHTEIDKEENEVARKLLKEALEDDEAIIYAHNYSFEHAISKYRLKKDVGLTPPPVTKWRCTRAMGNRAALHGSLDGLSADLELFVRKDPIGAALIRHFSIPQTRPSHALYGYRGGDIPEGVIKVRGGSLTTSEAYKLFVDYCKKDVEVEYSIHKALDAHAFEADYNREVLKSFLVDAKMKDRGIPIDTKSLDEVIRKVESYKDKISEEFREITGFEVTQRSKFQMYLNRHGYPYGNLASASREEWVAKGFYSRFEEEDHCAR